VWGQRRQHGSLATAPERPRFPFGLAFACVAIVLGALASLYLLARSNHETLAKGSLVPYTNSDVYRIRLFDRVTVYAQPESKETIEIVHSWLLVAVSSVSLMTVIFLWSTNGYEDRGVPAFFFFAWLGAGFLAIDEVIGVHENIGHNLRFLSDLPIINRPDEGVIAVYLLAALAFIVIFRRVLIRSRAALFFFALAFAMFVVAAVADMRDVHGEEVTEVIAASTLVIGFFVLTADELRRVMSRGPSQRP
jgi:hypothetical protein